MSSSRRGGRSDPPTGRPPSDPPATAGTPGAVITATAIAGLFVAALAPLPTYNVEARTLPLVVGVPATALALANVVRQFTLWRRARGKRDRAGHPRLGFQSRLRRLTTRRADDAASIAAAVGWVIAAAASMLLLGFLWGSAVFMPAFMLLYGRERPITILLYAGGLLVVLYLVFITGLNVPYFPGVFAD